MSIPLSFLRGRASPDASLSLADSLADALCHTNFVQGFALPHSPGRATLGPNDRVMVVLPTGPENALALWRCTAAELRDDARRLNAKVVITTRDAETRLQLCALDCEVVFIEPRASGPCALFDMSVMGAAAQAPREQSRLHGLQDRSLILHTSGTSGKKKVVPYTLLSLIVGTCSVVESWDLRSKDINFNMMPLFHVGGIVRNLLAVLRRADYAPRHPSVKTASLVPAMNLSIRMIANAAGGLLPGLAVDLRKTFQAVILPSYGMTECMPIASPSVSYRLERPGCSGIACGPYLSIREPSNIENAFAANRTGAICVRGLPTFQGYEVSPDPDVPLDTSPFTSEGWFDTGDMGYIDEDGYLFVTGRSKEIINRGGEVISPFEIEEAIMTAAKDYVKASTTLAFSIDHDVLQETIGVVVVPVSTKPRLGLAQLQDLLRDHLHPSKWPVAVVYMMRVNPCGFAFQSPRYWCLSDSVPPLQRHFEADVPDALSPLSEPIGCRQVTFSVPAIERALLDIDGVHEVAARSCEDGSVEAFVYAHKLTSQELKQLISGVLPGYAVPQSLHAKASEINTSAMSEHALLLRDIIGNLLVIDTAKINSDSDFFLLGGNSLLLGKLAYLIRKETGINIPVTTLFRHTTLTEIVSLIDDATSSLESSSITDSYIEGQNREEETLNRHGMDPSELTPLLDKRFASIPFVLFHPLKYAFTWTILLLTLAALAPELERNFKGIFWTRILCLLTAMATAKLAGGIVSPLAAIMFKWIVIGKYKPGRYRMWSTYYLRYGLWIRASAMPVGVRDAAACDVPLLSRNVRALITPLLQLALDCSPSSIHNSYTLSKSVLMTAFSILGTHYEGVSINLDGLSRNGRQDWTQGSFIIEALPPGLIYSSDLWPNSGFFCLDPELLEIGNDVVFGSRSEVLTTDCLGTAKIVVGDGAMIADRVVLLPGAKIGRLALMGSGALAMRDKEYKEGSIWLGTDCLDDGSEQDLNHDTSTPFGRAFYQGKAPYIVYPYFLIVVFNIAIIASSTTYWSICAVLAAQVLRRVSLGAHIHGYQLYPRSWLTPGLVYGINSLSFVAFLNIQAILVIFWMIAVKWVLIGRRRDGRYAWDTSSYCQRWQLQLVISGFVDKGYRTAGVLGSLTGTAYLVWYLRAMGAKIGKDCALYPGGKAGLMSEPDLVRLGDNVSLDDCSVVAHINSRGDFS
ncbi:hypothetical protein B0H13DRAFT_2471972 [Mycena leptocephala]|nr:hypothetical protein B0H13DRAFT_2471972 [Mycena leptocephala]